MSSVFENNCASSCGEDGWAGGYLLSPMSKSANSPVFDVAANERVLLRAFNLQATQKIVVEMVTGSGAGQIVAPAAIDGAALELTTTNTMMQIAAMGRYRIVAKVGSALVDPGEFMPTVELLRS